MTLTFPTYECLRTTFFFQSPNRIMTMPLYWQPDVDLSGMGADMILNLANGFFDVAAPVFAELVDNYCSIEKCRAEWWGKAGDGYWDAFSTSAAIPGERGGVADGEDIVAEVVNTLPDFNALVIQRRTGKQGRQNRGRVFMPCLSEYVQTNGQLDAGKFGVANDIASFISSDITVATFLFHARHFNRKEHKLEVITQARVLRTLSHRTDRAPRGLRLPT